MDAMNLVDYLMHWTRNSEIRSIHRGRGRTLVPLINGESDAAVFSRPRSTVARDANFDAMNLATPGKDASNPDKPPPKKALFSSPPAGTYTKDKNLTPSTTEKRNTRERCA